MISVGKIKNILLHDIKENAVLGQINEIVPDKHSPVTEGSVAERIVVVVPGGIDNGQMSRSFPRVCVYVPDITFTKEDGTRYNRPNGERLMNLENECINAFRSGIYGRTDEDVYIYRIEEITQESDPGTWSHYINMRLRFEVINTKLQ